MIDSGGATIRFTFEELAILASSLNELSNSTSESAFALQVGATREEAQALIGALVATLEKSASLQRGEIASG
jgi:hypothetical protein